jgi:NADH-quinone oxidoreductase subunit L
MQADIDHCYLIPLLPLIGAAIAGFFGARFLKGQSHWPIWITVGASAVLSLALLFGMVSHVNSDSEHGGHETGNYFDHAQWYTWIDTGGDAATSTFNPAGDKSPQRFIARAGALIDPLTAVMLSIVCGIGFLITVFAAGYMKGEAGYFRFFAYLGLFIFSMTCLVMGENLIMLYLGWEGVGLCSYLLIGYYYEKPAAREAAKKAFLVNRVGDFGFGLGIMLTFLVFGTVSYFGGGSSDDAHRTMGFLDLAAQYATNPAQLAALPDWKQNAIQWIPFLLMVGAFGKSAQFPLHVWLPDAMEGPTPVSALIHAATMVTAGVYMIARCSTVFVLNQWALPVVAAVGLFTAIFAATIALRQFDLKKVFAYSTVSQLGFMFVAVGLLAPVAGVFHLVTHAFFKALLFLSSGVVMHAMAGELDLRKMSGLKRVLPKTRWLMLIGCLALAGMVPFSGFWSKDEIVVAAFIRRTPHGILGGSLLLATAFLTAYYTFRLYFRVFEGPEVVPAPPVEGHGHGGQHAHADDHAHASTSAVQTGTAHESGVDPHLATDAAHHGAAAHGDAHHHDHEPGIMIYPLIVLAVGAALAGFLNTPFFGHHLGNFLGHSPSFNQGYLATKTAFGNPDWLDPLAWGQHAEKHESHWLPMLLMLVSVAVAAMGIGLAYIFHLAQRRSAEKIAGYMPAITRTLEGKYWIDELYQALIVEPLRSLGRAFFAIDRFVVDGLVWLISFIPQAGGWILKLGVQRGYLQGYAAVMLFGVAVILLIIFL